MVARHIIFVGRVQGVGFRFAAHGMANRHQLAGFVRNLSNGTVEMLAQGTSDDIEDCIQDLKEYYPGYIREINIEEIPPDPQHTDFRITF
jgi:acylphosphatase